MEIGRTLAEQLADLVQRDPQNYDVVFSVGPEKIKVPAVKIILKAASSVFERKFNGEWESAMMKEGDGIPLPDIDPTVFELFVELIISDTWSADALINLLGPAPATALSLLELCRRFEITKAIKNLEVTVDSFVRNFTNFKDTHEFLEISRENLKSILSCDKIPMDEMEIFECACRWVEHQCQQKKMELTSENFREVLGDCFYEIRFPIMKFEDFAKVSVVKPNILAHSEKAAIFTFIWLDDDEKSRYDKTRLTFKTNPRNSVGFSVLRISDLFHVTENPPFACVGNLIGHLFEANKKISLIGIGFLGPIEGDTNYDVTVQIKRWTNDSWVFSSGTLTKNIFAQKGSIFRFLFDEPIQIEPHSDNRDWKNQNYIYYSLMGANNLSQYEAGRPKIEFAERSGVEFNLYSSWSRSSPLAELLYKRN